MRITTYPSINFLFYVLVSWSLCAYQAVNLNLLEEYILAVKELAFLLRSVNFLRLTLLNPPCLQVVCVLRMICATFNLMSLLLEKQRARNSDFD